MSKTAASGREKAKVAVLISGRGSNMAALLYASRLPNCPYEIILVAANDPEAAGLKLAQAEGVATFAKSHKGMKRAEFDAIIDAEIRRSGAQYVALAGYMRLLSPEFVEKWEGRMINIHPSLLPAYKGLDTHQRALDAGEKWAGCSVHLVTAELDDGPVLGQTRVAILPGDDADTLAARTLIAEHQLYSRVLWELVTREKSPEFLLSRLRELAQALPQTDEVLSNNTPCFGVKGGRKFAYFIHNQHGEKGSAVIVKASSVEEQTMLIESEPDLYYRPPYFGPAGWVGIRLDDPDWDHIGQWVRRSWLSVAPKKLAGLIAVADEF